MSASTETVEWYGERFHVAERVGMMPMMRYAAFTKRQMQRQRNGHEPTGEDEIEALASSYELLERCLHPNDWERFEEHASAVGADLEELMEFVGQVMVVVANRPTGRSSDSSDGPRTIEPSSPDASSSPDTGAENVVAMFNDRGRADLALLVRRRQESLTG